MVPSFFWKRPSPRVLPYSETREKKDDRAARTERDDPRETRCDSARCGLDTSAFPPRSDGARLLAGKFRSLVRDDQAMKAQYRNLGVFLVYTFTLLGMITLQRDVADPSKRLQGLAAKNLWLGRSVAISTNEAMVASEAGPEERGAVMCLPPRSPRSQIT